MNAVELAAPAKLTLSLRITGLRPDGYHLIEAEMVTLDLADRLIIEPGDGLVVVDAGAGITADRQGSPGATHVPAGSDNLVARALDLAGRRVLGDAAQVDPGRRGSRRRFRGRGGDPALGGLRRRAPRRAVGRRCGVLPPGRPGAGRRHRGDHRAPAVRTAHLHALHPALWLFHGRGVPGLGRTRRALPVRRATTSRPPRWPLSLAWANFATLWRRPPTSGRASPAAARPGSWRGRVRGRDGGWCRRSRRWRWPERRLSGPCGAGSGYVGASCGTSSCACACGAS